MVIVIEGTALSGKRVKLHRVTVLPGDGGKDDVPASSPPRAVLVWHHGLGEHVGRYKQVFATLADAGMAVYSQDAVGHGRSEGGRAVIRRFEDLVGDLSALAATVRADAAARWPNAAPPFFLAGHSLGGLVAATLAQRDQGAWAGLLVCSPAMDIEWTCLVRVQVALASLIAACFPSARIVAAVREEDMTPDPECIKEYRADPLITLGNVAACTSIQILKAMRRLKRRWPEFALPLLALHGGADRCTSLPATRAFVESAASKDKASLSAGGAAWGMHRGALRGMMHSSDRPLLDHPSAMAASRTLHVVEGGYHEVLIGRGGAVLPPVQVAWARQHGDVPGPFKQAALTASACVLAAAALIQPAAAFADAAPAAPAADVAAAAASAGSQEEGGDIMPMLFGNGCYWGRQYDFVQAEEAMGRKGGDVSAVVGYAGGRLASPDGRVCYHFAPPQTLYERLGHAEVVQVELRGGEAAKREQYRKFAQTYFSQAGLPSGKMQRQDPLDAGPAYRCGAAGTGGETSKGGQGETSVAHAPASDWSGLVL
eukprot:scaffold9.g3059.t1